MNCHSRFQMINSQLQLFLFVPWVPGCVTSLTFGMWDELRGYFTSLENDFHLWRFEIIWSSMIWAPVMQQVSSVQFNSVAQLCLTLCDPMNSSMPGLPVHHQLSEFTQTHGYRVADAIQPSHPLSSPSPPAPNPS